MNIKKIKSQRGNKVVIYNDFIYNYASKILETERFRCQIRTCNANLFIEVDRVVSEKPHTRAPDPIKAKKIQIQANIKTETKNTSKPENVIIMNIITRLEDKETAILTKIKNIKDSIIKKETKQLVIYIGILQTFQNT
ncbi:hypothetical protein CDIK_4257 [Cucumispora dikerogammari]|nr:hypothetical protein CDIK_4257 [Cucumispora dikerogammari]